MATILNENVTAAESTDSDSARQRLLTDARVPRTRILLDRLTLVPGGKARMTVPAHGLAWFQMLEGEAPLAHGANRQPSSDAHVMFLPPRSATTVSSSRGAALLRAR